MNISKSDQDKINRGDRILGPDPLKDAGRTPIKRK